jgi:uncharacterized SAM-binding protein YcdF (DUF218 family)
MDYVYHYVAHVSSPFLILVLWTGLACAWLWWKGSCSRQQLFLSLIVPVALLLVLSTPIAAYFALGSLEWRYPLHEQQPTPRRAVVVLSGGIYPPDDVRVEAELTVETVSRCLHAARLYRQHGPCQILVSGGKTLPDLRGPTLAVAMRDFLLQQGVADEHLWMEDESSSTYENAVQCRGLLEGHGIDEIVLVTHAVHMYRSARCFRRQGLKVIPAACGYRATAWELALSEFLPTPQAARWVQEAYHEWLGILWYWLLDRI